MWSHLSPLHPELWPEVHVCAHSDLGLLGMSVFLWVSAAVTREIPQFSSITLGDVTGNTGGAGTHVHVPLCCSVLLLNIY